MTIKVIATSKRGAGQRLVGCAWMVDEAPPDDKR